MVMIYFLNVACLRTADAPALGGMEQTPKLSGFINERTKSKEEKRKIFPKLHSTVKNICAKGGNGISLKMENNDGLDDTGIFSVHLRKS